MDSRLRGNDDTCFYAIESEGGRRMRILVVEDDTVLAAALTRALNQAAYTVDLAENGHDANSALDSAEYDLVVLDLALPKLDGLAVLGRLRDRRVPVPV